MAFPLATEAAVRAVVADAFFKRGKELLAADKLQDVRFEGELMERATAICGGSSPGDSYDLSIIIDPTDSSKPICSCSCPVKKVWTCKHCVALLLFRARELQKGATNSVSCDEDDGAKEHDDVEDPADSGMEWVSNPDIIVPDPRVRRVLPTWMTEEPIIVEKKKGRARKKQKVEEGAADNPPKGAPTRRRTRAPASNKDGDNGDQANEQLAAKKSSSRRPPRKKRGADEDENTSPKPSGGRSKRLAQRQEQDEIEDSSPSARPQQRYQVEEDDTSFQDDPNGGDGMDLTSDDLLSMAQQHLRSPAEADDAVPDATGTQTALKQAPEKAKTDSSILCTGLPSDRSGSSSTLLLGRNVSSSSAGAAQAAAAPSPPPKLDAADAIANDMFDLMFGAGLPRAAPVEQARPVQQQSEDADKLPDNSIGYGDKSNNNNYNNNRNSNSSSSSSMLSGYKSSVKSSSSSSGGASLLPPDAPSSSSGLQSSDDKPLGVQVTPKKKSSLRSQMEMLLG